MRPMLLWLAPLAFVAAPPAAAKPAMTPAEAAAVRLAIDRGS